jgi:hypothetical protein
MLVYIPTVEPPLDEIEIDARHPRGRDRPSKPYLTVSLDCLELIVRRATRVVDPDDVPRLMASLCRHAIEADISDHGLARQLMARFEEQFVE